MNISIASFVLTTLALAAGSAANAAVIDFESAASTTAPNFPAIGHGEEFSSNGFWFAGHSNSAFAEPGDLIGAMLNGADKQSSNCMDWYMVCPINNDTRYYGLLNDGVLGFGREDGASFRVNKLQASFLAPDLDYYNTPLTTLVMHFQGTKANGDVLSVNVRLPGPLHGEYKFRNYTVPANFASVDFMQMAVYGMACNTIRVCTAFDSNRGQFVLDNIDVTVATPVPEPAAWLLMSLGLVAVLARARRRPTQA